MNATKETMPSLTRGSLHHAILRKFIDDGYPPTTSELCARFGVDADRVQSALHDLAAYHGVVLHPHNSEVWIAHPFSSAPTLFDVRKGGCHWWGNCAWCALGVAALVGGHGVTIQTTLGADADPTTIHIDDQHVRENLLVHFPIPMARAWDNVVYTCSTMLVFGADSDVDVWSRRHAIPRGDVQPIQRVYEFAAAWYSRHLNDDWRKWTTDEARELFQRFGLGGPIWQLPRSDERF
jgi:hypothetical protein